MREVVIDTNALISFVTDRAPDQQEKIGLLLEDAASLKAAILCPQNVITEFVYVLEKIYDRPKDQIRSLVSELIDLPGLQVVHEIDFRLLLTYWPNQIPDFGDALIAVTCLVHKGSCVATFDRKLKSALKLVGLPIAEL